MKKFKVISINAYGDEFDVIETDDKQEAISKADGEWQHLTDREKKNSIVEIRTDFQFGSKNDEQDGIYYGYDLVEWRL